MEISPTIALDNYHYNYNHSIEHVIIFSQINAILSYCFGKTVAVPPLQLPPSLVNANHFQQKHAFEQTVTFFRANDPILV